MYALYYHLKFSIACCRRFSEIFQHLLAGIIPYKWRLLANSHMRCNQAFLKNPRYLLIIMYTVSVMEMRTESVVQLWFIVNNVSCGTTTIAMT